MIHILLVFSLLVSNISGKYDSSVMVDIFPIISILFLILFMVVGVISSNINIPYRPTV